MDGLDPARLRRTVESYLAEDIGRGDLTTDALVPPDVPGRARLVTREPSVVAGLEVARACFEALAPGEVSWTSEIADGARCEASIVASLKAPMRAILTAERTALNLLGRLSGIATLTERFVAAVDGTPARIVDTRKTTPGLRWLEKYAVRVGGGSNHRSGLDDGVLLKDNHIAAAGGVPEAVRRARAGVPHGFRIEVEVTTLDELDAAVAEGADAVLLDNMSPDEVRRAVERAGGKVLLEASGGITLDNVREFAVAGADLISIGALTHTARSIDVSLEVGS